MFVLSVGYTFGGEGYSLPYDSTAWQQDSYTLGRS